MAGDMLNPICSVSPEWYSTSIEYNTVKYNTIIFVQSRWKTDRIVQKLENHWVQEIHTTQSNLYAGDRYIKQGDAHHF